MKRGVLLAGLGLSAAAALAAPWLAGRWHPSRAQFPRQGIDVSHHQGTIDWQALRAQQVDFAYIKASEGGDFTDPAFARNWRAAAEAGIARGAYHFFTLCRSGAEQAAHFIATVPVDADALPPAVDLEYLGNCAGHPKVTDFHRELEQFLAPVEAHYGKRAVLYTTAEFDRAYQLSARWDRPLWLRSLVFEPGYAARPWRIWQVSNFRRLDGIEGRVDWNVERR